MNKAKITISILALSFPMVAKANVVWPALYTETKLYSFPIIILSLVIEFLFFKWLFELKRKNAIIYTLVANTASGVIGLFVRPLSGIAYEVSLGAVVNWLFN